MEKRIIEEVDDYADQASQEDIQLARSIIRDCRLGRAAVSSWEEQQVFTVRTADKRLKSFLSDKLRENSRKTKG